jgi:diaminopimelate dehydrogenase
VIYLLYYQIKGEFDMTIKIGIMGYGNLGKGVECSISQNNDMSLYGIFTRRNPQSVKPLLESTKVFSADEILKHKDKIDVLIICGGSATDLPVQTPALVKDFNVVDSFDTHAKIPEHFENVDAVARKSGKIAVISAGWDPGMFSIARLYSSAILPNGKDYTFWGEGVSQGHSDAIRRIDGVIDARQYTVPVKETLARVRAGEKADFTTREKHTRNCFVVAEENADKAEIEKKIKQMPNYFADYDTTVTFITMEEMKKNHSSLPHGGFVIRSGNTGLDNENGHIIEYSLKLDSNPEFTASVIVAYARAAYKMNSEKICGCKTAFDIAPSYLSSKSGAELRKELL